jgi:hypothetical protein
MEETITVKKAGRLKYYTFSRPAEVITHLSITGIIDARDVRFIRDEMERLEVLDLSGVTIGYYSGLEGTKNDCFYSYPADEMPTYSFIDYKTGISKQSLVSIVLPSWLISIGDMAFSWCNRLTGELILPTGLRSIGFMSFFCCSELTSVRFPSRLAAIGWYAFDSCVKLTSIDIPSSLAYLGYGAFSKCKRLTSVLNLPPELITIEKCAFIDCTRLTEIVNNNPMPLKIEADVFKGINKSICTLKVPAESVALYKAASVWKDFKISSITE